MEEAGEWEDVGEDGVADRAGLINLIANDETNSSADNDITSTGSTVTLSGFSRNQFSRNSTRKRKGKPGPRTVFIAANPRKAYTISPITSPRTTSGSEADTNMRPSFRTVVPPPPIVTKEELQNAATRGARFTAIYVVDVVGRGIRWLRYPLSILLAVYMIALILNQISSFFYTVFQPLCIIPGISGTYLCKPSLSESKFPSADYPRMIELQTKSFEQLLDESVKGSGLSMEVKKAEMATSDLVTLINFSQLKSKDIMAETLREFVQDARLTARGLNRLNAKVMGAVDECVHISLD